jgi:hypothetical protein
VVLPARLGAGSGPIRQRLAWSDSRILVTTDRLFRMKVAEVIETLPELTHVLVVRGSRAGLDG